MCEKVYERNVQGPSDQVGAKGLGERVQLQENKKEEVMLRSKKKITSSELGNGEKRTKIQVTNQKSSLSSDKKLHLRSTFSHQKYRWHRSLFTSTYSESLRAVTEVSSLFVPDVAFGWEM